MISSKDVIDRVIEVLKLRDSKHLAEILGEKVSNIYSWRNRNTLNWTAILELCKNEDYHYILHGAKLTDKPIQKKAKDKAMQRASDFIHEKFETISRFGDIVNISPKLIYLYLYDETVFADQKFIQALMKYGCDKEWLLNGKEKVDYAPIEAKESLSKQSKEVELTDEIKSFIQQISKATLRDFVKELRNEEKK